MRSSTAVITGATSGLGYESARALLRRDASWHVVLAVRDHERGQAVAESLGQPERCSVLKLDLASLASVHAFTAAPPAFVAAPSWPPASSPSRSSRGPRLRSSRPIGGGWAGRFPG